MAINTFKNNQVQVLYAKLYSDKDPQFIKRDVFRILVPLDDNYSFGMDNFKLNRDDALDH